MEPYGPLVTTAWLGDHLDAGDIRIVDGSWRMPGEGPARDDYMRRHIPGAVFFDIDEIADRRSKLPHMLPPSDVFEHAVGKLGISNKDRVVIYDDHGIYSAPRVWWTFRAMGHCDAAVLDGGLPKWVAENRPVTDAAPSAAPAYYAADPIRGAARTAAEIRKIVKGGGAAIIDARPMGRFAGETAEPRPGLKTGHMPGARNVPYISVLDDHGVMRGPDELKKIFAAAGVDADSEVITTCGSGVTAAVLSLALERLGHRRHSLYDGSWTEWGSESHAESEYPVVTGKA